jgi:hypothetical protein
MPAINVPKTISIPNLLVGGKEDREKIAKPVHMMSMA